MTSLETWITALSTFSATREKILEHRFVADVTSELWRRAIFDFAVSRSEVDNSGYDLIIEALGVTRHIQLKAMQSAGKRRDFDIQVRLAHKQSGCAVLMLHHPATLAIEGYRFFGAGAGHPLPSLGDKPVKHSKGNAQGHKAERPALRNVAVSAFTPVADIIDLTSRLFAHDDSLGDQPVSVYSAPIPGVPLTRG